MRFLLGEESSYLSGLEIPVDGGQTAHGGMKLLSHAVRTAASWSSVSLRGGTPGSARPSGPGRNTSLETTIGPSA